jgi:hypothetical protein
VLPLDKESGGIITQDEGTLALHAAQSRAIAFQPLRTASK